TTCATCVWSPSASRAPPSTGKRAAARTSARISSRRAKRGCGTRPSASQGSGCRLEAKLKIRRGVSGEPGRLTLYEVPFDPGQTVLDGLRWIRVHRDPSLAIRFSCINANACKECMIRVDGKTVYACTTRLAERQMTLAPLPNKALIKDLVTEIAPPDERLVPR